MSADVAKANRMQAMSDSDFITVDTGTGPVSAPPVGLTAADFSVQSSSPNGLQRQAESAMLGLPKRFGVYTAESQLGEGAMACVYLARHRTLGLRCALKLLRPEYEADPRIRERFLREGRVLASLNHPNLVRVHDLVEPAGTDPGYLVMELLRGETLEARIERVGALSLIDALDFATQIAGGLAAVHKKGVAHRDLKPANIFLAEGEDGQEHVKILDFGIAKGFEGTTTHGTRPGALIGTPAYMAPEQVLGEPVDHLVDVYQFGLILYEMLTGRLPCEEKSLPDVLMWHTTPHEVELPKHVPQEILDIVQECLKVELAERLASMTEIRRRLNHAPRARLAEPQFVQSSRAELAAHLHGPVARQEVAEVEPKEKLSETLQLASGSRMVLVASLLMGLVAVAATAWLSFTAASGPGPMQAPLLRHTPSFRQVVLHPAQGNEPASKVAVAVAPARAVARKSDIHTVVDRSAVKPEARPPAANSADSMATDGARALPEKRGRVSRSATKSPF